MPSIQDVADQINAKLDQVNTNTAQTAQNTALTHQVAQEIRNELVQVNGQLTSIDQNIQVGLANVAQGIFALFQLQKVAVALLDHHRKQNDTIICELVHANDQLCEISRKFSRQLELSAESLVHLTRLDGIAERALAEEAGDYDRHVEIQERMDECCPPPETPPEPCPEHCDQPEYKATRPTGQDWRPLEPPTPHEPVG